MKLEDVFERIFVINLPFKEERRRRVEATVSESGVADPAKLVWVRAVCGDWTPPPVWWGAGNGAWGCLMSHLRVGQDAVHDKLDSYCVLEDDVIFHPRAGEMLERFIRELPSDWGQVYLGGQFLHKPPRQVSPWVVEPYNVNRTHAYALSRKVVPRFLQHILHAPDYYKMVVNEKGRPKMEYNFFHIDHQLGRAHQGPLWKTYAPTWWLAGQREGDSNISGRTNPRLWWHSRERGSMLPFFQVEAGTEGERRKTLCRYLHFGNNLVDGSLLDVGLNKELKDEELVKWLKMIAGEAMERWKLPGFETPVGQPDLPHRVRHLWDAGVLEAEEPWLEAAADYPFNGFCGGVP